MAFTDSEISEIKYRLGYGGMTALANPYIDTAPAFETIVAQYASDFIVAEVRDTILPNLRSLDDKRLPATNRLKATELIGEIRLNEKELLQLADEYTYWLNRLSSAIRIPIARPPQGAGGGGVHSVILA